MENPNSVQPVASKKEVLRKLANIQMDIDVPKVQYNTEGKYNYRSAEDILAALKPFLKREGCTFKLTDEVVCVNGRFYIKATAYLIDIESEQYISAAAYAQEYNNGRMNAAQSTGCASSYARKYAMNALFLLDDIKDADADEVKNIENEAAKRANNTGGNNNAAQNGGYYPQNNGSHIQGNNCPQNNSNYIQGNNYPQNNGNYIQENNYPQNNYNQSGNYR